MAAITKPATKKHRRLKRLPRRVKLGPYVVDVVLASQATLREVMDDDEQGLYNGCWEHLDDGKPDGRIYVLETLSVLEKWRTFWHEMHHAVTDLEGWDLTLRQVDV